MLLVGVTGLLAIASAFDGSEQINAGEYLVPDTSSDIGEVFRDEDHATKYVFMNYKAPWNEAYIICNAKHSSLATPLTKEKLQFIGIALAESIIGNQNLWVGGKVTGNVPKWVDSGEEINANSNDTEWADRPSHIADLDKRACVSIYRRMHNIPMLATLDCDLHRPFICESHMDNITTQPVEVMPSENIKGIKYSLYLGEVTWKEAITYCRGQKKVLATFKDLNVIRQISRKLLRLRPVVENAWIGGSFNAEADNWMWLEDSSVIPDKMDNATKFPPWYTHDVTKKSGCVLLDRHLCEDTVFVPAYCERRRPFICMESTGDSSSMYTRPGGNDSNYFLSTTAKTWPDAFQFCKESFDKGSLAIVKTQEELDTIVDLMSISHDEVHHVWINGKLDFPRKKYFWVEDVTPRVDIDFSKFKPGVMCDSTTDYRPSMGCLNLDRQNHNQPLLYGLSCSIRQRFFCFSSEGSASTDVKDDEVTSPQTTEDPSTFETTTGSASTDVKDDEVTSPQTTEDPSTYETTPGSASTDVKDDEVTSPQTTEYPSTYETTPALPCKPGYTLMSGIGCYKGNRTQLSWDAARLFCEAEGAHLATPDSEQELDAMDTIRTRAGMYYPWIGVHKMDGVWQTIEGGPGFLRWAPKEPAGDGDCVIMYKAKLNNYNCDWNRVFICEHTPM